MLEQVSLNGSQTEGTVNTVKIAKFELPITGTVKRVVMSRCIIALEPPEVITNLLTQHTAGIALGDCVAAFTAVGSPTMAIVGAVGCAIVRIQAATAPHVDAVTDINPKEFFPNREVLKSNDSKYYITVCNLGVANTAAKTVYFSAEFMVEK